MQVLRDPEGPATPEVGTVVTIGAYDGVHLGHVAVLTRVRELADARGLVAALLTFDRHPAQVVRPESAPKVLTPLDQKLAALARTGLLDLVCVLTFDEARRRETAAAFVREVLVERLRARQVVVGADFHFGYERQGTVPFLRQMGEELGFGVEAIDLVAAEDAEPGTAYSSTLIRGLLMAGDVDRAARLLGRPHEVRGEVVSGDGRGRDLGFPTANVEVDDEVCLPAEGIYAGWLVDAEGASRAAAISLGRRPTFYEEDAPPALLEAHVLDFDGDLYGEQVRVQFVRRLRDERRFESAEELGRQMERDVQAVRELLGEPS